MRMSSPSLSTLLLHNDDNLKNNQIMLMKIDRSLAVGVRETLSPMQTGLER